jgi:hypothetical protein
MQDMHNQESACHPEIKQKKKKNSKFGYNSKSQLNNQSQQASNNEN